MKLCILIIALLASAGCATTETTITTPDNGQIFSMKTTTLFKDVKDVSGNASSQGFQFDLGTSSNTVQPELIACMLAPHLCRN